MAGKRQFKRVRQPSSSSEEDDRRPDKRELSSMVKLHPVNMSNYQRHKVKQEKVSEKESSNEEESNSSSCHRNNNRVVIKSEPRSNTDEEDNSEQRQPERKKQYQRIKPVSESSGSDSDSEDDNKRSRRNGRKTKKGSSSNSDDDKRKRRKIQRRQPKRDSSSSESDDSSEEEPRPRKTCKTKIENARVSQRGRNGHRRVKRYSSSSESKESSEEEPQPRKTRKTKKETARVSQRGRNGHRRVKKEPSPDSSEDDSESSTTSSSSSSKGNIEFESASEDDGTDKSCTTSETDEVDDDGSSKLCIVCKNLGKAKIKGRSKSKSTDWCKCGHCKIIGPMKDYDLVCCREIKDVVVFLNDEMEDASKKNLCITSHPRFEEDVIKCRALCRTGGYRRTDYYGNSDAYKSTWSFIRMIWDRLGWSKRMVVPACVTSEIKEKYHTAHITSFVAVTTCETGVRNHSHCVQSQE